MATKREDSLWDELEMAAAALDAARLIGLAKMLRDRSKHLRTELSYDGRVANVVRESTSNYEAYRRDNMRKTLEDIELVLAGAPAGTGGRR